MTTNTRISIVLALSVAFAAFACGGASVSGGPASAVTTTAGAITLDGTSYDVTLEFPGEAPVQDTLRFASGRFGSSACAPFGFPEWTDYRARGEGAATSFEVTTKNPSGVTMEWRGTIQGAALSGTATRTTSGERSVAHFKGVRRS